MALSENPRFTTNVRLNRRKCTPRDLELHTYTLNIFFIRNKNFFLKHHSKLRNGKIFLHILRHGNLHFFSTEFCLKKFLFQNKKRSLVKPRKIKKQEIIVRFSSVSYKNRLSVGRCKWKEDDDAHK